MTDTDILEIAELRLVQLQRTMHNFTYGDFDLELSCVVKVHDGKIKHITIENHENKCRRSFKPEDL